jgi:RNA-splicing ligase RtcB
MPPEAMEGRQIVDDLAERGIRSVVHRRGVAEEAPGAYKDAALWYWLREAGFAGGAAGALRPLCLDQRKLMRR